VSYTHEIVLKSLYEKKRKGKEDDNKKCKNKKKSIETFALPARPRRPCCEALRRR
jgi:hypothetical protein